LGFFGLKTNHLATLNSGGVHFAKVPSRNNKKTFYLFLPSSHSFPLLQKNLPQITLSLFNQFSRI
jgi:hypothetical protein